jgi:glycerol kinase
MVHATDYSNASATGLYDTFELGWNQQLFSVVGLPPSIFPEVRNSMHAVLEAPHCAVTARDERTE